MPTSTAATSKCIDISDPLKPLLAIRPDTKSNHFQWFHFKASGLHVGQEHWFRLNNASQSSYNKAWTGYQAVASYDHVNWFRVPTIFEGDCLRFSLEATAPTPGLPTSNPTAVAAMTG